MSETLQLARDLIARPSVTPDDAGCQALIAARLQKLGFRTEIMQIGDVTNLWARRGTASPLLCLAGHTDVVPTGPEQDWTHPPFEPTERRLKQARTDSEARAAAGDPPAAADADRPPARWALATR